MKIYKFRSGSTRDDVRWTCVTIRLDWFVLSVMLNDDSSINMRFWVDEYLADDSMDNWSCWSFTDFLLESLLFRIKSIDLSLGYI